MWTHLYPNNQKEMPEDIAETICYTLLQKSLTGQIIRADNGQTM